MENEYQTSRCPTYEVSIYVAGDIQLARRCCQQFMMKHPRCVTITPTSFVYTGGTEEGVVVSFRNYPRFTPDTASLLVLAGELAEKLVEEMGQWSAMIVTPLETVWITRRKEETPEVVGGGGGQ